ncbi:MAG: hypothetical protein IKP81_12410 [Paludibacteraceae bacterium]|nr:hypothetical protein [Paludibacteraceae bacterium]
MKKIIGTCLLLTTLYSHAGTKYMTVEQKTGEKFSFLLANKPVVTYENNELVVNGSGSSFVVDDLKNFYFTDEDLSGVANNTTDVLSVVKTDENTIRVENAAAGVAVKLVSASGSVVATGTTDQNGAASLSFPKQTGVYVMTIGNNSFKVVRN